MRAYLSTDQSVGDVEDQEDQSSADGSEGVSSDSDDDGLRPEDDDDDDDEPDCPGSADQGRTRIAISFPLLSSLGARKSLFRERSLSVAD